MNNIKSQKILKRIISVAMNIVITVATMWFIPLQTEATSSAAIQDMQDDLNSQIQENKENLSELNSLTNSLSNEQAQVLN